MSLSEFDVSPDVLACALYPDGSYQDLALRGFSREYILERTGKDVGYHNHKVARELTGVDRDVYRARYVAENRNMSFVERLFSDIAAGHSSVKFVCEQCGFGSFTCFSCGKLFSLLGLGDEYKIIKAKGQRAVMQAGCVAKFGVDNVFKLSKYQSLAGDTRESKYGARYTLQNGSSLAEGARDTFRKHLQDDEFAGAVVSKREATMLQRYGFKYCLQDEAKRFEFEQTMVSRYGVRSWAQLESSRELLSRVSKETAVSRREKIRSTCMKRYGVDSWNKTAGGRALAKQVGDAHAADGMSKLRAAMVQKYGYEYNMQRPEMRAWLSDFMKSHSAEFQDKSRRTSFHRYGVEYWTQTDIAREMQSRRMLDFAYQKHIVEIKKLKGNLNTSTCEVDAFGLLLDVFGIDSVEHGYFSDVYPHNCDFFVMCPDGRRVFCEVNGSWTHSDHWFDIDSDFDRNMAFGWLSKDNAYYSNAFTTWCKRDVQKRFDASRSGILYLVIWDWAHLLDLKLWLAMGCPDCYDWKYEYSWLPDIDFSEFSTGEYSHEVDIWKINGSTGRGLMKGRVYSELFYRFGLLPSQVSCLDVLQMVRTLSSSRKD